MGEKSKNETLSFLRYLLEEFKRNPDVFPNLRIDIDRKIKEIEDPLNEIFIDDEDKCSCCGTYEKDMRILCRSCLNGKRESWKKLNDEEILKELGKYLKRKGWDVPLIEEEGILKGDEGKKNSFRLSFKFIGKKK